MKTALKTFFDTIKVFAIFGCCTVLFYFGLKWLDQNYEGYHKYDVPSDGAVKVFQSTDDNGYPSATWSERLFQFLRDGE